MDKKIHDNTAMFENVEEENKSSQFEFNGAINCAILSASSILGMRRYSARHTFVRDWAYWFNIC